LAKDADSEKLDEMDRMIVECVIHNPRITVHGIVQRLDEHYKTPMSESAVQKRLAELLSQRRLERVIQVRDWTAADYSFRYRVDLKADMRELRLGRGGPPDDDQPVDSQKKLCHYVKEVLGRRYQGRLVILDVTILLGQQADLSITLRAKDSKAILDFVTEDLRVLGGVEATMTSHEAWTYGEFDPR